MRIAILLLPLLVAPGTARGQDLAARIAAASPNAPVRLTYDAKPGVCGDGENILLARDGEEDMSVLRNRTRTGRFSMSDLRARCDEGPVRVTLERSAARITDVDVEVGGRADQPAGLVDLGHVAPDAAVAWLLDTLVPAAAERAARDAIFAATLADAVEPWPSLLRIARDRTIERDVRRHAVFWVGQAAAAERATEGLVAIASADDEDIEIRKHALFALSQRNDEGSFDALLGVARSSDHRELRKTAIFWLGQSDDPRALAFFEEILVRR